MSGTSSNSTRGSPTHPVDNAVVDSPVTLPLVPFSSRNNLVESDHDINAPRATACIPALTEHLTAATSTDRLEKLHEPVPGIFIDKTTVSVEGSVTVQDSILYVSACSDKSIRSTVANSAPAVEASPIAVADVTKGDILPAESGHKRRRTPSPVQPVVFVEGIATDSVVDLTRYAGANNSNNDADMSAVAPGQMVAAGGSVRQSVIDLTRDETPQLDYGDDEDDTTPAAAVQTLCPASATEMRDASDTVMPVASESRTADQPNAAPVMAISESHAADQHITAPATLTASESDAAELPSDDPAKAAASDSRAAELPIAVPVTIDATESHAADRQSTAPATSTYPESHAAELPSDDPAKAAASKSHAAEQHNAIPRGVTSSGINSALAYIKKVC
jgi:hypothetical protein